MATLPIFDLLARYDACQNIVNQCRDAFERIDGVLPECVPYAAKLVDQVYEHLDRAQSDILEWFNKHPAPASFAFRTGDGSSIEVNVHRADLSPDFVAEIIGTDANGQKQAYRVRRDLDNIARDLLFIHHRHIGAAGLPDIFNSLKE